MSGQLDELLRLGPPPGTPVLRIPGPLSEAAVLERPNRFAVRLSDGRLCHLHDPGRLPELIFPGNRVLIRPTTGARTGCSVTGAWSSEAGSWVLTDSRFHPPIARAFLPPSAEPEVKVGESRLDFRVGDVYVEVKGCTLARQGVALFPDAPTERGTRHVILLRRLAAEGHGALLMVLVMRPDATCFLPNEATDRRFAEAFWEALSSGVRVRVLKFRFRPPDLVYEGEIPLCGRGSPARG